MKNAALTGKPYAGNPHVRFDEGEVASAKPRRGSLLYNRNNMRCRCVALAAGLLVGAASAMTFDELKSAVEAAEDGAVVEVSSDVEITGALNISKRLTLTSKTGGARRTLRWMLANDSNAFVFSNGADLVLTNLVFDGNKAAGMRGRIGTLNTGMLTLADGAWLKDFKRDATTPGGIALCSSARLVMEAGAQISGFESGDYGTAVLVGNGSGGVFDMRGGSITGCKSNYAYAAADYGGAVYVYGGTFNFSGGLITGNVSEKCSAGIVAYSGAVDISGNATATNNVGGSANDLFVLCTVRLDPGFTGRLTLRYSNNASVGQSAGITVKGGERMIGAGRISNELNPELIGDAYTSATPGSVVWNGPAAFQVNGVSIASWEEMYAAVGEEGVAEVLRDIVGNVCRRMPASVRKITFRSAKGAMRRFDRHLTSKEEWPTTLLWLENESTTVRLENIVLDGSGGGWTDNGLIAIDAGTLELGPGAILENSLSARLGGAVALNGAKATLKMEDGAVIRNCGTESAGSYGAAVCVGNNSAARFEMSGGIISNCVCKATSAPNNGYGGIVYLYGGTFEMTGGRIVGNAGSNGASGIYSWSGRICFGGDAVVSNNLGKCGDLYCNGSTTACFSGDFRGWVGVSHGSKAEGDTFRILPEVGATGSWCFHQSGEEGAADLVGVTNEENPTSAIKWGKVSGWVGEMAFASAEDAARGLPKRLMLDEPGRSELPIIVSGTAREIDNATVDLDFDPSEFAKAEIEEVALFIPGEGAIDRGWKFNLPGGVVGWTVARRLGGYVLCKRSVGTAIIIR